MTGRRHRGDSLLETILFLGIVAILSSTIVGIYISTQEVRIRQRAIAEVEQRGTQVLTTITNSIRDAEAVLDPRPSHTGSVLALQMAGNSEFPTIFAPWDSGRNILLIRKTSTSALLGQNLVLTNMVFARVGTGTIVLSFSIRADIPTVPTRPYLRTFAGTATLFPDHQSEAGGCGSCSVLPSCVEGNYEWYTCENGACSGTPVKLPCS